MGRYQPRKTTRIMLHHQPRVHIGHRIPSHDTTGPRGRAPSPVALSEVDGDEEVLCTPEEREKLTYALIHNRTSRQKCSSDFYAFGKVVGVGSFAKVRVARHKLTGQKVAIKTYEKAKI